MGCSGLRTIGQEEQSLIFAEKRLGLHLKHISEVYIELTKDTESGRLSDGQMDQFIRYLRLPIQGSEPDSWMEAMFGFFKKEDGYCLETLMISACLLSMGSTSEKAATLFKYCARNDDKKLTREQVHKLISIMVSISIDYIPKLLFASRVNIKPNVIKSYAQSLGQSREIAVNALTFELMGHSEILQQINFVMKITRSELRQILEPKGIRKFLLSLDCPE